MLTKLANAEGKGQITMLDLLVNSLRQRPDRIIVGEIRRKEEAETLFEAIHTGHSVYATVHANDAKETVNRLINPPIQIPKMMLPGVSIIVNQYRNRRTGKRKTFEVAEIMESGDLNILVKYNPGKDKFFRTGQPKVIIETLQTFTGITASGLVADLAEKGKVLKYLLEMGYDEVEGIGHVMAEYYTNKENLMKYIAAKKKFGGK
jgi:flagellar protein FlaI